MMPGNDKNVTISVNSIDQTVPHEKLSYDQVVEFVFPGGSSSGAVYIIKYSRGEGDKEKHVLERNDEVMVSNGMRFRVSPTGES